MIFKLQKGIYSTIQNPNKPFEKRGLTVAVHPFYFRTNGISKKDEIYEIELNEELRRSKNHLIILEESFRIFASVDEITKFYISHPFIVPTIESDPTPSECDWNEIIIFIKKLWDEKNPIKLIGGFLWMGDNPTERGCLGFTEYKLNEEYNLPVEVIHTLTFH